MAETRDDTPTSLGEFGRIGRFLRPLAAGFPGARSLSDDAALIDCAPGEVLVVTTDTLVAGVHFIGDEGPADIAAKALRVNLSDLAGMGARPVCYTLNLALPKMVDDGWLAAFCDGLAADQAAFDIHLAGGDSVATPGPVTITVTAFGAVKPAEALHRDGARAGDDLWVSGTIGDGLLGLEAARAHGFGDAAAYLIGRYRRPEPRVALGRVLAGVARAALDVSDGLISDAGHMAAASGLAIGIDCPAVPFSGAASDILADEPGRLPDLLTGGDDYELLFAAPPGERAAVEAAGRRTDTRVSRIGRLVAGEVGAVTACDADGSALEFARPGYRHG
ncbi:thiamine-phosphate kinase [Marivibrio halodurans]|uniref:Thiamine-monophosphate kinase n=1 Tax=Marivibrio halodurans TaxID=2039722 RepID=A0A8J7RZ85_9PROT|nr:thiamine-phosphate kinase [Marivibrio halodurans]MBP5855794.1 thiamine-phosphate kinase [Marivibrio halodurans]